MFKKLFILSTLVCLLIGGIAVYRQFSSSKEDSQSLGKLKSSSPQKETTQTSEIKLNESSLETDSSPRVLSVGEIKKIDDRINEMESKWKAAIEEVFIKEMKLTQEDFKEYLMMREGYEEDRYEAYEDYHRENLKEKGHYPITNEDDANQKITQEYHTLFKNHFGEESFARYVKRLDEFNSELRRNGQDKEILTIDF